MAETVCHRTVSSPHSKSAWALLSKKGPLTGRMFLGIVGAFTLTKGNDRGGFGAAQTSYANVSAMELLRGRWYDT